MKRFLTLLALICCAPNAFAADDPCHPEIDPSKRQFIIGYGSLMETASKKRSSPTSGLNHPVFVSGFKRAWNTRGATVGFSTTYLGVLVDNEKDEVSGKEPYIAAVVYEDRDLSDIEGTDQRETYYCRVAVAKDRIDLLDGWALPEDAEVWIYALKPEDAFPPSIEWPIVQSYVDIFLTGCMQLQQQILPKRAQSIDFPKECIKTTHEWSDHWKNDRLYPRRPFIYQPNAEDIDKLLSKEVEKHFPKIVIE